MDLALRGSYTRFGGTKQQLDRRLDLPLKLDVLGVWNSPQTPLDRRTDLGLATAYIGLGAEANEWMVWTVYAGGGAGRDSEHQRFGTLNLETAFEYLHVYTGVLLEMYPWGRPAVSARLGFVDSIKASRPYLLAGLELGFVEAKGRGHFSAAPIRLYEDSYSVRDWLVSHLIGAGWGFPIDDRWAFNVSTHYAFHYYRPGEYNSWVVTTSLRYEF